MGRSSLASVRPLLVVALLAGAAGAAIAQDVPPPTNCCCPPQSQGPAVIGQLILDDGPATPIYGFSFGGTQQGGGAGGGGAAAGRFDATDFQVVKIPDQVTTALLEAAFTGRRFRGVVIRLFQDANAEAPMVLAEYQLFEAFVSGIQTGAGAETITENVSFRAARFRVTVTPPGGGNYMFGWDFQRNRRF